MNQKNDIQTLEMLSAALRTVGGNFDIPTLDLILSVLEEVKSKGNAISIGDVKELSRKVMDKYKTHEQQPNP